MSRLTSRRLPITKVEPAEDGPEKETQLYQGFPVKKQLPNGNTITVTEWKRIVELDALGIDFEDDEARVA